MRAVTENVRTDALAPAIAPHGTEPLRKLILVTACFYPDGHGGAERQAKILAHAIGERGVDVTIIAPTIWRDAPAVEATAFGRIERFPVKAYPNAGGRHIGDFLSWTRWFRRHVTPRLGPATPVYVFHARLHALGPALAARAAGAPLLIKLGGGGEASDFAALRAKRFFYGTWVQTFLLARTSCFVANSAQIATDLTDLGVPMARIASFPNGVLLPPAEDISAALTRRTGRLFLSSARMVQDKNVAVLYEAAARLLADGAALRMTFLGDGPERQRLAAMSDHAGTTDRITFSGFVSDVYAELMEADFFVSASLREGQSNAMLEAMSAGVIPIICGASGAEIVIDGTTGFHVVGTDAVSFAETMRKALALSTERRRQMAMAARDFAQANISVGAIAEKTIALAQSLIAKGSRDPG